MSNPSFETHTEDVFELRIEVRTRVHGKTLKDAIDAATEGLSISPYRDEFNFELVKAKRLY